MNAPQLGRKRRVGQFFDLLSKGSMAITALGVQPKSTYNVFQSSNILSRTYHSAPNVFQLPTEVRQSNSSDSTVHSVHEITDLLSDYIDDYISEESSDEILAQIKAGSTTCNVLHLKDIGSTTILEQVGLAIFQAHGFLNHVAGISFEFKSLQSFLLLVAKQYQSLPYHNEEHAADVLYSTHCLLLQSPQLCQWIAPWQKLAIFFAAILHDINHTGFNTEYLRQINHPIIQQYGYSESPLERMHYETGISFLRSYLSSFWTPPEEFYALIEECILNTDICHQSRVILPLQTPIVPKQCVLGAIVHLADISSGTKPFEIHEIWTARITEEFYHQGDLQRSQHLPISIGCDREEGMIASQLWFLRNIVLPAFETFNEIEYMNVEPQLDRLRSNIERWEQQL